MNLKRKKQNLLLLLGLLMAVLSSNAQNLTLPRSSQYVEITQRVGISDITITYHSPGANGRKIWGGLVPYGQIWRAGANENTTIAFSHDARVEGVEIKAGTYGLYMLPKDENNVRLLLSNYSKSWGTVAPAESDLALLVDVSTKENTHKEWLSYDFVDRVGNNVTAVLCWETKQVPFKIEFDVPNIVLENIRAELKGPAGFSWRGYSQAAQYCVQNNINLEEAMTWIDQSINMSKGFTNLSVKSQLLAINGNIEEAKKVMQEAIPTANAFQLNQYGYQVLNAGNTKEAIDIFKMNVDKNPNHQFIWGFTDSLGEAYLKDGNKKLALKYYRKAKELAPENQYAYLDGVIASIESTN